MADPATTSNSLLPNTPEGGAMKAESIGWIVAAMVLWVFVYAGDNEIFAAVGVVTFFIGASMCTMRALSLFFPGFFDPLAKYAKKIKRPE